MLIDISYFISRGHMDKNELGHGLTKYACGFGGSQLNIISQTARTAKMP